MTKSKELIIDPELNALLDNLSTMETQELELSIEAEGVREPIIVWKGHNVIVDGHNRYSIATTLDKPYKVIEREFPDKQAVINFMIRNQLGRRNLTPERRNYFIGVLYNETKGKAAEGERTSETIAKQFGVSEKTVRRDGDFAKGVDLLSRGVEEITEDSPELAKLKEKLNKKTILDGTSGLNSSDIQSVSSASSPKVAAKAAAAIIEKKAATPKPAPKETPKAEPKQSGPTFDIIMACPKVEIAADETFTHDLKKPKIANDASIYLLMRQEEIECAFDILDEWGFTYDGMMVIPTKEEYEDRHSRCNFMVVICGGRGCGVPIPSKSLSKAILDTTDDPLKVLGGLVSKYYPKKDRLDMTGTFTGDHWK